MKSTTFAPSARAEFEAAADRRFRRAIAQRFPYVIFFRELPDSIEILAVAHAAREPAGVSSRGMMNGSDRMPARPMNRLSNASMALLVWVPASSDIAGCATNSAASDEETFHLYSPSRVFVPALPECPPDQEAISVRDAGKALLGKRIAFRGVLTLDQGRSCDCSVCPVDEWRVVEAETRVYDVNKGRPPTALLISLPDSLSRDDFSSPDLDVVATGVLLGGEGRSPHYYKEFVLEDAEVCRETASSPNHVIPFPHPPRRLDGMSCVLDHDRAAAR
jgi:hypothetical protein